MKRNQFRVMLAVLASCTLVLAACVPRQRALSNEEAFQRFVGTWVNTDYRGTLLESQITVIRPDYVGEDWQFPDSKSSAGQWTIKIKETWMDEKGNTYCRFYLTRTQPASMRYSVGALMRVDKKRRVWEMCDRPSSTRNPPEADPVIYPKEIDPDLRYYYIYYRKN